MKIWLALCVAVSLPLWVWEAPSSAETHGKKVLFICTGNFYRSRFAEAVFNESAPKSWSAFSRGLDASTPRKTPVSPLVTEELARRHIPASRVAGTPQQLTQADLDHADLIVLLNGDEHLPMLKKQFPSLATDKVQSWSVADVPKLAAPEAFATIVRDATALIAELKLKK